MCGFIQHIVTLMRWMHWTVIFHRDLKAENLLLDSALNIKIAGESVSVWVYLAHCHANALDALDCYFPPRPQG